MKSQKYLQPTYFIDLDSVEIQEYAQSIKNGAPDSIERAVAIYYGVRDDFRYNPYRIPVQKEGYKASEVIKKGYGYCVTKALLLVAVWRASGFYARPGYADVKNHMTSPRLTEAMGTNIFYYHGYAEIYLNDIWVKATPAFDARLCKLAHIKPLEFDGLSDSIFHEFFENGSKHMEYLHDYGTFQDLPLNEMQKVYKQKYPNLIKFKDGLEGQFEKEVG